MDNVKGAAFKLRIENELQRPFIKQLDTPHLNQFTEVLQKTLDRYNLFSEEVDATLNNRTLTDAGKAEQLAARATASLETTWPYYGNVMTELDQDATRTRNNLMTVAAPERAGADSLLRFLFGQEIRHRYAALSQHEKDAAFLRAAESGRDETVWAILESPEDMITEEIKLRALEERARRTNPATYARLQQVELLRQHLGGVRDHLVSWLRSLGGDAEKIYDVLGGPLPPKDAKADAMKAVTA